MTTKAEAREAAVRAEKDGGVKMKYNYATKDGLCTANKEGAKLCRFHYPSPYKGVVCCYQDAGAVSMFCNCTDAVDARKKQHERENKPRPYKKPDVPWYSPSKLNKSTGCDCLHVAKSIDQTGEHLFYTWTCAECGQRFRKVSSDGYTESLKKRIEELEAAQ